MDPVAPAGPPLFLVPAGDLSGTVITLSGPEGHHAAAVRRLRPGERADVTDGVGTLAETTVIALARDSVTLDIHAVHKVPAPQPRLLVAQALPKGDRAELAVELMTEIGVDTIIPWSAGRSVTRWQGERGAKALARWHATAREAAKQSRRAWLPDVTGPATTADLAKRIAGHDRAPGEATAPAPARSPAAGTARDSAGAATRPLGIVLEADAPARLQELPLPASGDILLIVGPEGGITPAERATFREAGALEARLGPTVLRTSTAGATAAALLLSRTPRW